MDQLDRMLLQLLQEDGRITVSELSKRLSLSRPSISERLLRLQEKVRMANSKLIYAMIPNAPTSVIAAMNISSGP